MENKDNINELMDYFRSIENEPVEFDEEAIYSAYPRVDGNQPLSIKILAAIGGILASFAFLGFILIAGLYESQFVSVLFGVMFISGSILVNKKYNKITTDAIGVSCYIIGLLLLVSGLSTDIELNGVCLLYILISLGVMITVQNYMLSFVALITIVASIITLILTNKSYGMANIYVIMSALFMTYIFLHETLFITTYKRLSQLYNPLKIASVLSFLAGLVLFSNNKFISLATRYNWLHSIVIILFIIYVLSNVLSILNINLTKHKILIFAFAIITLLPTLFFPPISGAILIILISFMINYITGFVLGITSLICFICQFYYDLNLTLLTKSILLFLTGVLFIVSYLFTYLNINRNEE